MHLSGMQVLHLGQKGPLFQNDSLTWAITLKLELCDIDGLISPPC